MHAHRDESQDAYEPKSRAFVSGKGYPGKAQFFGSLQPFVEEMTVGADDVDQRQNGEGGKSEECRLNHNQTDGGV